MPIEISNLPNLKTRRVYTFESIIYISFNPQVKFKLCNYFMFLKRIQSIKSLTVSNFQIFEMSQVLGASAERVSFGVIILKYQKYQYFSLSIESGNPILKPFLLFDH